MILILSFYWLAAVVKDMCASKSDVDGIIAAIKMDNREKMVKHWKSIESSSDYLSSNEQSRDLVMKPLEYWISEYRRNSYTYRVLEKSYVEDKELMRLLLDDEESCREYWLRKILSRITARVSEISPDSKRPEFLQGLLELPQDDLEIDYFRMLLVFMIKLVAYSRSIAEVNDNPNYLVPRYPEVERGARMIIDYMFSVNPSSYKDVIGTTIKSIVQECSGVDARHASILLAAYLIVMNSDNPDNTVKGLIWNQVGSLLSNPKSSIPKPASNAFVLAMLKEDKLYLNSCKQDSPILKYVKDNVVDMVSLARSIAGVDRAGLEAYLNALDMRQQYDLREREGCISFGKYMGVQYCMRGQTNKDWWILKLFPQVREYMDKINDEQSEALISFQNIVEIPYAFIEGCHELGCKVNAADVLNEFQTIDTLNSNPLFRSLWETRSNALTPTAPTLPGAQEISNANTPSGNSNQMDTALERLAELENRPGHAFASIAPAAGFIPAQEAFPAIAFPPGIPGYQPNAPPAPPAPGITPQNAFQFPVPQPVFLPYPVQPAGQQQYYVPRIPESSPSGNQPPAALRGGDVNRSLYGPNGGMYSYPNAQY